MLFRYNTVDVDLSSGQPVIEVQAKEDGGEVGNNKNSENTAKQVLKDWSIGKFASEAKLRDDALQQLVGKMNMMKAEILAEMVVGQNKQTKLSNQVAKEGKDL